jgi:predicted nucleic acid-binding protein
VNRATLDAAIDPEATLRLDTTAVAAYLDASEATHDVSRVIVDELVGSARDVAAVSAVTAMELLVRPLRATPPADLAVRAFLEHQPGVTLVPVDLEVADAAARLRAEHRLAPPDALIVGTAFAVGIRYLITNDFEWRRKLDGLRLGPGRAIQVVTLADHLAP